jgi:signal transduction histidine kinase
MQDKVPARGDAEADLSLIETLTRKQLARRLHDGPTQLVAALAMRAGIALRLLATDPLAAAAELQALQDLARRTSGDMRRFQFMLMPQALERLGLATALGDLATITEETCPAKVRNHIDEDAASSLGPGSAMDVFLVACEAVENAAQHAQARQITLKISLPEPAVTLLEIDDDGQGFHVTSAKGPEDGMFGIALMRARVARLHGEVGIESSPGHGTKVRATLPAGEQSE